MDTIINPENGESLYLYSRDGLRVLDQYMIRYKGGANTEEAVKNENARLEAVEAEKIRQKEKMDTRLQERTQEKQKNYDKLKEFHEYVTPRIGDLEEDEYLKKLKYDKLDEKLINEKLWYAVSDVSFKDLLNCDYSKDTINKYDNDESGRSVYEQIFNKLRELFGTSPNIDLDDGEADDAWKGVLVKKVLEKYESNPDAIHSCNDCKCGRRVFPEDGEIQAYRLIPLYIKYCTEIDAIIKKTTLPEMDKRNSYVLPDILPKLKGDGTLYTKDEKNSKKVTNKWINAKYVTLDRRRKTWNELIHKFESYLKRINNERKKTFGDVPIPKIIKGKNSYTVTTKKKALGLKTKYNKIDVDIYTIGLPGDWFKAKKKGLVKIPKKNGFILGDSHYNYKNALNDETKNTEFKYFNKSEKSKGINCSVNACDIGACPTIKNNKEEKMLFNSSTKKNIFIRNFCNLKSSVLCNDPKICTGCGGKEMEYFKKLMYDDKKKSKKILQDIIKSLALKIEFISNKFKDEDVDSIDVYDCMYHLLNEKNDFSKKDIQWVEATVADEGTPEPENVTEAIIYVKEGSPVNVAATAPVKAVEAEAVEAEQVDNANNADADADVGDE